jgi:hypothetical protein
MIKRELRMVYTVRSIGRNGLQVPLGFYNWNEFSNIEDAKLAIEGNEERYRYSANFEEFVILPIYKFVIVENKK